MLFIPDASIFWGCFYGTHCKSCNYDTINNMMKLLPSKEEWKKSKVFGLLKAIAIASVILVLIITALSKYTCHRDVTINTDYEISDVEWQYNLDEVHKESSRKFNHFASYGMFCYRFDLYVDGRTIPAELEVMKLNANMHDAVIIDITPGDTASKVKVSVHVKGNRDVTEQFDINDEKIFIHIGA